MSTYFYRHKEVLKRPIFKLVVNSSANSSEVEVSPSITYLIVIFRIRIKHTPQIGLNLVHVRSFMNHIRGE